MNFVSFSKISRAHKLLGVLTSGHLVNDFYGVTLPFLLPALITEFSLRFFEAGLLSLAISLFSGILQPVIGNFADRFGRRKQIIMAGFFVFSLGLAIASSSATFPMLFIAFFIFGLGTSTFHAQSTTLISNAFPKHKGKSMGIHGIGGSIGNFTAPILITSLVGALSWRRATFFLAVPGILMLFFIWYALSDSPGTPGLVKRKAFISSKLLLLACIYSLVFMTFKGFLAFLPTYLVANGSSLNEAGGIATLMFIVGFIAQPAGGYIYDRLGGRFLFALSAFLLGTCIWLLTLVSGYASIFLVVMIGAASTATFPVALAMGSEIAKPGSVGASVGFVFGLSAVLASVTPAITGYGADLLGLQASFRLLVVIAGLAFIGAFFLPQKAPHHSKIV